MNFRRLFGTVFALAIVILFTAAPTGPVFNTPPRGTANIVSGSITGVSGVPYVWKRYHIPIIVAPTGTMANNGAITVGTAFATTYAGVYLTLPAGAIAAGVPASADTYYTQMSSATVGTVCNNRLADNLDSVGGPTIPASCTAFSTTGPGAYTGVTTAVTLLTLTLPASILSTTGILDADVQYTYGNTANSKLTTITFGGTNWTSVNQSANTGARFLGRAQNRNSASVQSLSGGYFTFSGGANGAAVGYSSVNTGAAVSIVFQMTHTTATDVAGVESIDLRVTN
jgi:hypothetical protein